MNPLFNPHNHLLNLARSGQRLPHIVLAIVLSIIFIVAAQLLGGIPAVIIVIGLSAFEAGGLSDDPNALLKLATPDTATEQLILLVLSFAPIFLILWVWLALFEKRPLWTLGLELRGAGQKYLRGLLVGLLMFGLSIGISAAFGYMAFETGDPQKQGLPALGGVLLVFLGWTVQGPAEEALARGWLLPVIGARYNLLLGVIISSVVFAAFHLLNPNLGPIAMLNLLLFGLFAAFYALYEGGLWGVFSLHAVWNWAQGNLFGLAVSGGPAAGGTLFNLMEDGPDAITGGPFGPEGGLAVTTVLIAACGLLWILGRKKKLEIRN